MYFHLYHFQTQFCPGPSEIRLIYTGNVSESILQERTACLFPNNIKSKQFALKLILPMDHCFTYYQKNRLVHPIKQNNILDELPSIFNHQNSASYHWHTAHLNQTPSGELCALLLSFAPLWLAACPRLMRSPHNQVTLMGAPFWDEAKGQFILSISCWTIKLYSVLLIYLLEKWMTWVT